MSRVARRLRIEGRVQGVGFRWHLHAEALRLGLGGWVRNRHDGSLEALVCGEEEDVDALTAWAHRGPDTARVDRLVCLDETGTTEFAGQLPFRRKPTV